MTDNPLDALPSPLKTRLMAARFEYDRAFRRLDAVQTEVREHLLPETRGLSKGTDR